MTIGKKIADKLQEINPIILRNLGSPQKVSFKADESIVTATDQQIEQLLLPELKRLLPKSSVIGEESAPTSSETVTRLFQVEYL